MRYPFFYILEVIQTLMNFMEKARSDAEEFMVDLIKTNDLTYVNEELVDIIFANYVSTLVMTTIKKWVVLFTMVSIVVYILISDPFAPVKWLNFMVAFVVSICIRPIVWSISEEAHERFTQDTIPDIFNSHKNLWSINNRKDDI